MYYDIFLFCVHIKYSPAFFIRCSQSQRGPKNNSSRTPNHAQIKIIGPLWSFFQNIKIAINYIARSRTVKNMQKTFFNIHLHSPSTSQSRHQNTHSTKMGKTNIQSHRRSWSAQLKIRPRFHLKR